jgi:aryl-alcohol dehydrogenase-like predicted oxidoreductase
LESVLLGGSGIAVSRLCFGTLTIGPLQRNMTALQGGKLLIYAREQGILFFDTAEIYDNYPHLRVLIQEYPDAVIATKSYAYDTRTAEASLKKATEGIGRDYIDLFLLHEQESIHTLRGHYEALEYFMHQKEKGRIGALGISTHRVAAARAALRYPEISVIHPLINLRGIGIADGGREDMEQAIDALHEAGRGIYAMKALGGGHLIGKRREAFAYILGLRGVQSVAVGMQNRKEIDNNVALFQGLIPSEEDEANLSKIERQLLIEEWCRGCGNCVSACKSGALSVRNGRSFVDQAKCVRCGYCAAVCPEFCIKVI